jgi:two-component system CheB/CheR fusion protein
MAKNKSPVTQKIIQQHPAQEVTMLSEQRLQHMLAGASDYAIITLDAQREVIGWSPGAQTITGYAEADILGQSGDILFTPEDLQQGVPQQEELISRERGQAESERWHLRKDGSRFWSSVSMSPLLDAGGQLQGFVKLMRDLTERRAALETRSFLAAIVESSQDSIVTINFDGIITTWNQAAETLYGYAPLQAIGQPLTMLTLQEDLGMLLSYTDRVKHSQKVEIFNTVRVNQDGRLMHLEIMMSPVKDPAGLVIGVSTIARDVTARKRAEDADALKKLTVLQQTESVAGAGSWEYDRANAELTWSEGMFRLLGIEQNQPVHTGIFEQITIADDKQKARELRDWLVIGTAPFELVLRIHVNGLVKHFKISGLVLYNEDRSPEKMLGVTWDITEQILAQEQGRELAENLQAVLDASPASIGLLKVVRDITEPEIIIDFKLAVGNQKLAEFFGQPLQQLLGKRADFFKPLLWGEQTFDFLLQVYQANTARYDEKLLGPGEQEHWLAVAVSRQEDNLVLTGLDVTKLKQAQEQQNFWLKELEKASQSSQTVTQLRNALQERGELLRSASHDLRGQVGIIASATQLLGMADGEDESSALIQMIQRNIRQMTHLMSSLLDFARLEAGQEFVQISRFNVSQVLAELVDGAEPFARERGIWLKSNGPAVLEIESDPVQIRRVAQNLLLNALKYTNAGGVTIEWQLLTDPSGWQLSVSDTGPGISAQQLDRLRGISRKDAPPATGPAFKKPGSEGIGLSIVTQLCTLLGGQLTVDSEPGEGTRFEVFFADTPPAA